MKKKKKREKKERKVTFRKNPWKWFINRVSSRGCQIGQIPEEPEVIKKKK